MSLEERIKEYDFVRLTMPDINGHHISKLIPSRLAEKICKKSTRIYSGIIAFGPRNEVVEIPDIWSRNLLNVPMRPIPETFHALPWATNKSTGQRVCEILCETEWINGDPMEAHPRYVARQQLERLEKLGYRLFSAFEPEYRAFKKDSYETFTQGEDMAKADLLCQYEEFFMDLDTNLAKIGILLQDLSNENGAGQLETPLMPLTGIRAADDYFVMKQATREIARQHDFRVSFMTTPLPNGTASGCHYNHSIVKLDGTPVMYDPAAENGLSSIALNWIGGLMHHLPAILALSSPTVNCYRRLNRDLAPNMQNWCVDNRLVAIRVKNEGPTGTYVENRLPSSASNPYIVLAATIAAGIDGIERNLSPPPMGREHAELGSLPLSLADALDKLEADKAFVEALGPKLVEWYLLLRREADLKVLAGVDITREDEESLAKEREEYFQFS